VKMSARSRRDRAVCVYRLDRSTLSWWPPEGAAADADPAFMGFGPPIEGHEGRGPGLAVFHGRARRLRLGPCAFVRLCRRKHPGFRPFSDRLPTDLAPFDGPRKARRSGGGARGGRPAAAWAIAITVNDRRGRCVSIRYVPARERSPFPTTFGERWARRFPGRAAAAAWLAAWEKRRPGWCYTPIQIN
jgi:hypothetical protein